MQVSALLLVAAIPCTIPRMPPSSDDDPWRNAGNRRPKTGTDQPKPNKNRPPLFFVTACGVASVGVGV
jgi:hypothetical protein